MANDDDACVNRRGNFEIDCTLHGAPVPFLGAGCDCPRDILDNRARWIAAERREVAHEVLDVRVEAERNKALGVAAQHSMAREKAERDLAKMTFDRDAWRATAEEATAEKSVEVERLITTLRHNEAWEAEHLAFNAVFIAANKSLVLPSFVNNAEGRLEALRWLLQRAIAGVELRERIEAALAPDQELP